MSYIKRAWLSVIRRKGKSLILLIVVFILGNLIAGTFAIKQATERVEENMKTKLGFNATISIDYDKIYENFDFESNQEMIFPKIPSELIEKVGSLPEVSFFDYSRKTTIFTKSLKTVSMGEGGNGFIQEGFVGADDDAVMINLQGVEYLDLLDAKVGRIEMAEGRTFKADDLEGDEVPVIVSSEFLQENNLRLDELVDVKTISQSVMGIEEDGKETVNTRDLKFRIVGTFNPITFGKDKDNNWSVVEMLNRIYVPNKYVMDILEYEFKTMEDMGIDPEENTYFQELLANHYEDSVFVTESEADLSNFVLQASAMLDENLIIKTSQQAFEMVAGSISMLSSFADWTLIGSAIITVIVLTLVVVLFLRDRKHEMGIYLALGDHQWKVLSQVTLEVVMITLMGLSLSFGTGLVLANKASEKMMWDRYGEEVMIDTQNSYIPAVNLSEIDEDYTIKITPSYIISVYAIGTVVAIAASVVPMFYVTRVKPKKILM